MIVLFFIDGISIRINRQPLTENRSENKAKACKVIIDFGYGVK